MMGVTSLTSTLFYVIWLFSITTFATYNIIRHTDMAKYEKIKEFKTGTVTECVLKCGDTEGCSGVNVTENEKDGRNCLLLKKKKTNLTGRVMDKNEVEKKGQFNIIEPIRTDIIFEEQLEPVHGMWSVWSAFGTCTKSCGPGRAIRTRTCSNPSPLYGGDGCVGQNIDEKSCEAKPCPIHGMWSVWSAFGTCSKSCGPGRAIRTRTCSNPSPAHGGDACVGQNTQHKSCELKRCIPRCLAKWLQGINISKCCTKNNPCEKGDGDCDDNNDCAGNLKCGNDNCGKDFKSTDDCCY